MSDPDVSLSLPFSLPDRNYSLNQRRKLSSVSLSKVNTTYSLIDSNSSHISLIELFYLNVTFISLGKSVKNKLLFTMTAYSGQIRMTLGQLSAALWDSQSLPDVIQPGFEPGTIVTPLALRCSALDHYQEL